MSQCFTVRVQRDKLVHSNRNAEKWRRTRLKNDVGPQAAWQAKKLRPVAQASIWVGVVKGNHARYDPSNLTDSMKPVVDALVKANILVDDSHKFTRGPWMIHLGFNAGLRDVVEFVVYIGRWGDSPDEARQAMAEFVKRK